jgi:hypothetical protein
MIGLKNLPISPAGQALGLGQADQLQSQVEAEVLNRKKKLLSDAQALPPAGVAMGMQMSAGNALSPMSLGLVGNA